MKNWTEEQCFNLDVLWRIIEIKEPESSNSALNLPVLVHVPPAQETICTKASSTRIRKFLKTLSRVETVLSDTETHVYVWAVVSGNLRIAYVVLLDPVFTARIISIKHDKQTWRSHKCHFKTARADYPCMVWIRTGCQRIGMKPVK